MLLERLSNINKFLYSNDEILEEGTIQFYNVDTGENLGIDNASNDNLETSTYFRLNNPLTSSEILDTLHDQISSKWNLPTS